MESQIVCHLPADSPRGAYSHTVDKTRERNTQNPGHVSESVFDTEPPVVHQSGHGQAR